MKRYGFLFEKVYETENLALAHIHASRGKGWYSEVKTVNQNLEEGLKLLQGILIHRN